MANYAEPPQFGDKLETDDPREIWWNQVLKYAKSFHGDFVELRNCPISRSTINGYKRLANGHPRVERGKVRLYWTPSAFRDPSFEVAFLNGKVYVRYIPNE